MAIRFIHAILCVIGVGKKSMKNKLLALINQIQSIGNRPDIREFREELLAEAKKYISHCEKLKEQNFNLHTANRKFLAGNSKLREALGFYADPDHWTIDWVEGGDYGNRARAALRGEE